MAPAGSTAVRDAVQKHQPMLALHGHIHDSRGTFKIDRGSAESLTTRSGFRTSLHSFSKKTCDQRQGRSVSIERWTHSLSVSIIVVDWAVRVEDSEYYCSPF
jgi:hypothetical protein